MVRIVKDLDAELDRPPRAGGRGHHRQRPHPQLPAPYLQARSPESVEVCALLVKEGEQRVELDLRYVGFTIPSDFVVGYGLDVAERYRNLAGVHSYLGTERGRPRRPRGREQRVERSVDIERVRARRGRAPGGHRRGPRARRAARHARPGGRHVRGAVLRALPTTRPATYRHLRRRPRRDGDGARHPLRLAVRAPPGPVHRPGARGLHPRRPTAGSPGCPSWPAWWTASPAGSRSKSA